MPMVNRRGRPKQFLSSSGTPASPPDGGWKSGNAKTPHGVYLINLIISEQVTANQVPADIWKEYPRLRVVNPYSKNFHCFVKNCRAAVAPKPSEDQDPSMSDSDSSSYDSYGSDSSDSSSHSINHQPERMTKPGGTFRARTSGAAKAAKEPMQNKNKAMSRNKQFLTPAGIFAAADNDAAIAIVQKLAGQTANTLKVQRSEGNPCHIRMWHESFIQSEDLIEQIFPRANPHDTNVVAMKSAMVAMNGNRSAEDFEGPPAVNEYILDMGIMVETSPSSWTMVLDDGTRTQMPGVFESPCGNFFVLHFTRADAEVGKVSTCFAYRTPPRQQHTQGAPPYGGGGGGAPHNGAQAHPFVPGAAPPYGGVAGGGGTTHPYRSVAGGGGAAPQYGGVTPGNGGAVPLYGGVTTGNGGVAPLYGGVTTGNGGTAPPYIGVSGGGGAAPLHGGVAGGGGFGGG